MTFTFKGKDYKFTDTLDVEDVHEQLLTEAVSTYNRKTLTAYIQGGDKDVTCNGELGCYLYLTAYDLETFVKTIMRLSNEGWEMNPQYRCSAFGKFSYTVTLVRSQEFMQKDADIIAASIPNLVTEYVVEFEEIRASAAAKHEKDLRAELTELGSVEARKRAIYRQLEQFKHKEKV